MKLAGMVLHSAAETQLDQFLSNTTHAVMLSGPAGIGKTHIATALSSRLLGTDSLDSYAYYRLVQPENGKISIEQIRELIGFFHLKVPGSSRIKRIAVIVDADTMGTEAQNALLKILEEPPKDSVLILTSSQPRRLLTTIQSRVQHMQLSAPTMEALNDHFLARGYSSAAINSALMRSGSNIANVESILGDSSDSSGATLDIVKKALGGNSYDRLLLVDSLTKQKGFAIEFVTTLATVAAASLETAANKGATSVDRWKSILLAAYTAETSLERNGNTKLVLTELMLAI